MFFKQVYIFLVIIDFTSAKDESNAVVYGFTIPNALMCKWYCDDLRGSGHSIGDFAHLEISRKSMASHLISFPHDMQDENFTF